VIKMEEKQTQDIEREEPTRIILERKTARSDLDEIGTYTLQLPEKETKEYGRDGMLSELARYLVEDCREEVTIYNGLAMNRLFYMVNVDLDHMVRGHNTAIKYYKKLKRRD
jgi:hypothetical protein